MEKTYIQLSYDFLKASKYFTQGEDPKFITSKEKCWVYRDNYWENLDLIELENEIIRLAACNDFLKNTSKSIVSSLARNIQALTGVKKLEIGSFIGQKKTDYIQYAPLSNGILSISYANNKITHELLPCSSSFFAPYVLPYNYDPNAKCDTFLKFLSEILSPEEIKFIRQWFGYCLVPVTLAEKFLILYGVGSNGKSVLLLILILLIGEDNISHVLLQGFESESDFTVGDTVGKLCNIVQEIDRIETFATGFLKEYVSGEMVRANEKFRPAYNFKPTARLIFATNFIPITKDDSEGLMRRIIILPFNKQFKGKAKDKKYKDKNFWINSGELSGIFNWALGGLSELMSNDWEFDEPLSAIEAKNGFKAIINPIAQFLEDYVEVSIGSEISVKQLYNRYKEYCKDYGFVKEHNNIFATNVRRKFPIAQYTENPRNRPTGRDRLWFNIRLIPNSPTPNSSASAHTTQTTQSFQGALFNLDEVIKNEYKAS